MVTIDRAPVTTRLMLDDHPLDVRAPKVEAEMPGARARHCHQASAVTRVYAAATTTMIEPNRTCRVGSGNPSTVSNAVSTVRMSAPTIVPA